MEGKMNTTSTPPQTKSLSEVLKTASIITLAVGAAATGASLVLEAVAALIRLRR
jgi:predicted ATPase